MNTVDDFLSEDRAYLAIEIIREARHVFGRADVVALWRQLGLPAPERGANEPPVEDPCETSVQRFFREFLVKDRQGKLVASAAWKAYGAWAMENGAEPLTLIAFGIQAGRAGFKRRKSGSMFYVGYRLP